MNEVTVEPTGDTLVYELRALLLGDGLIRAGEIVFYTSFGVVRGRLAPAFTKQLAGADWEACPARQMIQIEDAMVEHYSSHLPTGTFASLYVRLTDVHGVAFETPQPQS